MKVRIAFRALWPLATALPILLNGCSTARYRAEHPVLAAEPGGRIHLGASGAAITANEDAVWVIAAKKLFKIDPKSREIVATVPHISPPVLGQIAVGEGAVWVPRGDILSPGLRRVDLTTLEVTTIPAIGSHVCAGLGAAWVTNTRKNTLVRVDAHSNQVVANIPVGKAPTFVGISKGAVWVLNSDDATLMRIDPTNNQIAATIRIGPGTSSWKNLAGIYPAVYLGAAATADALWVTDYNNGSVVRIDTQSNEIARVIPVGQQAWHITGSERAVWVAAVAGANRVGARMFAIVRIDPANNTVVEKRIAGAELAGLACSAGDTLWGISRATDTVEWFQFDSATPAIP